MAPELLLHGHASRASDVYAFGILLVSVTVTAEPVAHCCISPGSPLK
jgi:serine/threonine protein kinase